MSDGKYRKSDKSYGYPSGKLCRFAHKHIKGHYICIIRSFDEDGNRIFRRSPICEEHRALNLQNGYACETYRGRRGAHMICDKCDFDMHCVGDYRIHNDGVSVFKCEKCGHIEEYT
jgi:hypothetical protein